MLFSPSTPRLFSGPLSALSFPSSKRHRFGDVMHPEESGNHDHQECSSSSSMVNPPKENISVLPEVVNVEKSSAFPKKEVPLNNSSYSTELTSDQCIDTKDINLHSVLNPKENLSICSSSLNEQPNTSLINHPLLYSLIPEESAFSENSHEMNETTSIDHLSCQQSSSLVHELDHYNNDSDDNDLLILNQVTSPIPKVSRRRFRMHLQTSPLTHIIDDDLRSSSSVLDENLSNPFFPNHSTATSSHDITHRFVTIGDTTRPPIHYPVMRQATITNLPLVVDIAEDEDACDVDLTESIEPNSQHITESIISEDDDDDDLECLGGHAPENTTRWHEITRGTTLPSHTENRASLWWSLYNAFMGVSPHGPVIPPLEPLPNSIPFTSHLNNQSVINTCTDFKEQRDDIKDPNHMISVMHPDDPGVVVEALMSKLTCPICYRGFRRKKIMSGYSHQLDLKQRDLIKMETQELEETKKRIDYILLERQNKKSTRDNSNISILPSLSPNHHTTNESVLTRSKRRRDSFIYPMDNTVYPPIENDHLSMSQYHLSSTEMIDDSKKRKKHEQDILHVLLDEKRPDYKDSSKSPEDDIIDTEHETTELRVGKCGHVYCKSCIKKYITIKKKCPVCNQSLSIRQLFPLFL